MGETGGMDGVGGADGWGGANGAGADGGDEIDKPESRKAMSRRRAINRAIYDPSHSSTYTSIQCDDQRYRYMKGIAEEITVVSGEEENFEGSTTSIDIQYSGHYYLSLQSVTVGNNDTYINPNGMWSKSAVMDTGTSGRWLVSGLYTELRIKIVAFMEDLGLNSTTDESRKLCYHGNFMTEPVNSQLTNAYTIASLHFANGADLDLDAKSLFYNTNKGKFCVDVNPRITEEAIYFDAYISFKPQIVTSKVDKESFDLGNLTNGSELATCHPEFKLVVTETSSTASSEEFVKLNYSRIIKWNIYNDSQVVVHGVEKFFDLPSIYQFY
ncbi:hypothetical protein FEM48_Zijuj01G0163000 [Ziziphus jujuba var. spinosa]|uniref:Xylanase inhibitor C-terminal domain-containing protein n=1 Tax=Ziziphus jujuba var. spinosa TaxID=714518 RepID=A0A978W298_ZIZJJ|nr:hypothetical protein FEM48_Zijuj01G0163000 [Ziziphus jujuba var. spinosa]